MPLFDLFWSMLWFFMFFAWIWLLISVYADVFRSSDLSGWGKAFWVIFMLALPWLGVLIYLIARGGSMQERAMNDMAAREQMTRSYIQEAAGTSGSVSAADELTKLAELRDRGVLTPEEFNSQKALLLK